MVSFTDQIRCVMSLDWRTLPSTSSETAPRSMAPVTAIGWTGPTGAE
jgi:hypothetical protein